MCESSVYFEEDGEQELVLADVAYMMPTEDGWLLTTIFGEKKAVAGRIKEINLLDHKIILTAQ